MPIRKANDKLVKVHLILRPSDPRNINAARQLSLRIFEKFNEIKQTMVAERLVPSRNFDAANSIRGLVNTGYHIHAEATISKEKVMLFKNALRRVKTPDGKYHLSGVSVEIVK
ncbi:MAG: hypothetical protein KGH61_01795 [Candidatus Micrarchaeota archaeon]|nr:hypothetical protein [Candidatus Micrarchaeota archaeon]MDE1847663.1 hypothetical protein [Candidatus Micrarchaeota archaeon]MDE1864484.1 hypothetical protein [Candidatus Micrarchaeota archaeon]